MQEKIRGIVLRTVKYKDTDLIVDLFTENYGRMSFVTTVAHGRRRQGGASAFWRPLNCVEFVADLHAANRLARPRDVRLYINYGDIPYSATKSMLSLFLAEFLSYTLREQQADDPLYGYLEHSLQWLDAAAGGSVANFHLCFLMRLTRFVGIGVDDARASGLTSLVQPSEQPYVPLMLRMTFANLHRFRLSRAQRQRMLEVIQAYYRLHLPAFPDLRSLDVLREVFD